ncbi:MAG: hypothetical protein ISS79_02795 [Phycisphaerae bacterium]|nr:hypothetical protein [Phycisphaerae bacterium]
MKKTKQNGFVLLLVIAAITAIGVVMFILAVDSNTMIFQSDTAYLRAVQRNLTASALALAQHSVKTERTETFNKSVQLDVADLNAGDAKLDVTIQAQEGREPQVQINTSATRKRRTIKSQNKYTIVL